MRLTCLAYADHEQIANNQAATVVYMPVYDYRSSGVG
jgi:hypothetical protein